MEINCPEAGYSKVSAIRLNADRVGGDLVMIKKGSLKVQGNLVTFTGMLSASDIDQLHVLPADRLAAR